MPPPFAELDALSNFTFLTGASHPEEYVARAAELGIDAIAIADVNTVAGLVKPKATVSDSSQAIDSSIAKVFLEAKRQQC